MNRVVALPESDRTAIGQAEEAEAAGHVRMQQHVAGCSECALTAQLGFAGALPPTALRDRFCSEGQKVLEEIGAARLEKLRITQQYQEIHHRDELEKERPFRDELGRL